MVAMETSQIRSATFGNIDICTLCIHDVVSHHFGNKAYCNVIVNLEIICYNRRNSETERLQFALLRWTFHQDL